MREVSSCAPPEPSAPAPPEPDPSPELLRRQAVADLLAEARCPVCLRRLVCRMTCRGPAFVCLCDDRRGG